MDVSLRAVSSILIVLAIVSLVVGLRKSGFLEVRYKDVFSTLVTHVSLPALIVVSLIEAELEWAEIEIAGLMLAATLVCLGLGWLIARSFTLAGPSRGAVILATGFGSSSLLGFALISEVFPGDSDAMAEAVILSGLGVQPLLFTLGAMIAGYYGEVGGRGPSATQAMLAFLISPLCLAMVVGFALSFILNADHLHPVVASAVDGLRVAADANTMLVMLAVGLCLQFERFGQILRLAAAVGAVKLFVLPALLALGGNLFDFEAWQVEVMLLEGAMPSGMLAVVLCNAYGAHAKLAAQLVFATTVAAIVTVPIVLLFTT